MKWFLFFWDELKVFLFIVFVFFAIVLAGSLAGCINLQDKAIAGETKGLFADISIPSVMIAGMPAIMSMKIGIMDAQWSSAPNTSKSKIKNNFENISFWTLSGSGSSELSTENLSDTSGAK